MKFAVSCALFCALCGVAAIATECNEVDLKDIDLKQHGIEAVEPKKDPKTGFTLGGKNSTESLKTLTELAGRSIAELQRQMRPGATGKGGSDAGFLGKDEKLLDVLQADNRFVVDEKRLTHQELAKHLHALGVIAAKYPDQEIVYHGHRYKTKLSPSRGYQYSPFDDGTKTNSEVSVENAATGKSIKYSLLVPHMIERYGFYEGRGTPYRVDPAKVLEVFDFLTNDT
jgi:hypothetical protein